VLALDFGSVLKNSPEPLSKVRGSESRFIFLCLITVAIVSGQGIPVTDPLVIAKCGNCHAPDQHGNMQRISWERTTPEGWQDALKRMIVTNSVSLSAPEARSIVKYLSTYHGLAPEEAKPVMYDVERRIHEESNVPSENVRRTCTKCHSFARALSWRRSLEDWQQFSDLHAARFHFPPNAEAVAFLSKAAPLHTPEWDAWIAGTHTQNLAGRWLLTASIPGRGKFYGEMQVQPADSTQGDVEFNTSVLLTSVNDGSRILRAGRTVVYSTYAWRGRSKGGQPAGAAPDDVNNEAREVLWIAPDQSTAEGRWFWGQYQEFGYDVKMRRASSDPTLLLVDQSSLKIGTQANRVRLIGDRLPTQVSPGDLDFGPGVTVHRIVSNTPHEVIAELDVAADAPLGRHDVALFRSMAPGAVAIYDRVDYIKVVPDSALAAFGDQTRPRGYQQFEAIGYQRGADGKPHTADDVELGPLGPRGPKDEVAWSLEVFYSAPGSSADFVGQISPTGFFTPALSNPNNNFDVWVIATAKSKKGANGRPLIGKGYLVVTVPSYTFGGHRYVRDLDRWVDDGAAQ
jgi:quinohemoprotein amine dehydrogenase